MNQPSGGEHHGLSAPAKGDSLESRRSSEEA
jgi:hypothetical protein